MTATPKHRLRATVTYTVEYEPRAEDYVQDGGTITLREMAAMDQDQGDPYWMIDDPSAARTVKVEVIR